MLVQPNAGKTTFMPIRSLLLLLRGNVKFRGQVSLRLSPSGVFSYSYHRSYAAFMLERRDLRLAWTLSGDYLGILLTLRMNTILLQILTINEPLFTERAKMLLVMTNN